MKTISLPKPRRVTPLTVIASFLAGGMLGIIASAIAVILTAQARPVTQNTCYTNITGLIVRVIDVNMDTITYGGWHGGRYVIWTRGTKHFLNYYDEVSCND